jgi:hypothetical protein
MHTYRQALGFIEKKSTVEYKIGTGFVPNMRVPVTFFVNDAISPLLFEELEHYCKSGGYGGFLPAVTQMANVAALPGIVKASIGLPDCHSGYGFSIGNVAAFDMSDPDAIVSPGGVGFDINCGVRVIKTRLTEKEVSPYKEELAQALFDHIPVGVGSMGVIPTSFEDLDAALVSLLFSSVPSMFSCDLFFTRSWEWTGLFVKATLGRKTRNIARRTAECFRLIRHQFRCGPRDGGNLRWVLLVPGTIMQRFKL